MEEQEIRTALNQDWAASASGDQNTEHEIYADDAVCDYPQSGERILADAICSSAQPSPWQALGIRDQEALRIRRLVDH